jgi:hypothetical protein
VDVSAAPELAARIGEVHRIADTYYPQILGLLGASDVRSSRKFMVKFGATPRGYPGETIGQTITLRADWVRAHPDDLPRLMVHEMTHVAQQYPPRAAIPGYWVEGIADYVCARLGVTNEWSVLQCNAARSHFRSGYGCSAAFLLHLDRVYGSSVVQQLNQKLHDDAYSDQVLATATGVALAELWKEFQEQPAYLAEAAAINELYQQVGYEPGRPAPADLDSRMQAILKEGPAGQLSLEALEFVGQLARRRQLPGLSRSVDGEFAPNGMLSLWPDPQCLLIDTDEQFPVSRIMLGRRTDSEATLHFEAIKDSVDGTWSLRRAWITAPGGEVIAEYSR